MKYLIVGLGNIGAEYADTRHNIGFKVVDALAQSSGAGFTTQRYGDVAEFNYRGQRLVVLKPSTYMNNSGRAVRYWLDKAGVEIENLLVVVDDLALPTGALRLRGKGSDGGHNGLRDIQFTLERTEYARLRCGIGSDFAQGRQVDFVLGSWSAEERKLVEEQIASAVDIVHSFVVRGLAATMNDFNRVENAKLKIEN